MRSFGVYRIYDISKFEKQGKSYIGWSNDLLNVLAKFDESIHEGAKGIIDIKNIKSIPEDKLRIETLKQFTVSDALYDELNSFKINAYLICQTSVFIRQYNSIENGFNLCNPYDMYRRGKTPGSWPSINLESFNQYIKMNSKIFNVSNTPSIDFFRGWRTPKNQTSSSEYKSGISITKFVLRFVDSKYYATEIEAGHNFRSWMVNKGYMVKIKSKNKAFPYQYAPAEKYKDMFVFSKTGKSHRITLETAKRLEEEYINEHPELKRGTMT